MMSVVRHCAFAAAVLLSSVAALNAGEFNKTVSVGDAAPEWKDLAGVDGKKHSLSDFESAKVVVQVFFSNHCFVAQNYEERLLNLAKKFSPQGAQFVFVSVSQLEEDGLEEMKKRADEKKYAFPYLHDPSQKTGRAYGARVTPQVFVLDKERKIAYMGAIDDNWESESLVKENHLQNALDAILAGKSPTVAESKAKGCSIEYQ